MKEVTDGDGWEINDDKAGAGCEIKDVTAGAGLETKDVKVGAGREKNDGRAGGGLEIKDGTMAPESGNDEGKRGAGVDETKPDDGIIELGGENV